MDARNDAPTLMRGNKAAAQRAGLDVLLSLAEGVAATAPLPPIRLQPSPARPSTPGTAVPGRHSARGQKRAADRHLVRFPVFAAIGIGVFMLGLGIQVSLVRELLIASVPAYVIQGVVSIQVSFLLNRYVTWRDRSITFWRAAWRFNAQKAAVTVINVLAYAVLIRIGMQYVIANVAMTAVLTPVSYLASHYWSFTINKLADPQAQAPINGKALLSKLGAQPTVSAVIPCKANAATIRATVSALLAQDYSCLNEVICVGDIGDATWAALADISDPRLVILEQEKAHGKRDPNVKRNKGILKASGEVIALVDSDIVMDPHWLSTAVRRLHEQGGGLVAGGMRSIHDSFYGRFVDRNALAAKTPRLGQPYTVTAQNFGRRGFKPPITANAVLTRSLYDACPLDTEWAYGYEDYEWFWRLARESHRILFTGEMTAAHHHRRDIKGLVREYSRSARGCAHFALAHSDSPLARKRLWQAALLPVAGVAALVVVALAVAAGLATAATAGAATVLGFLMIRESVRAKSAEGLIYPFLALPLAVVFTLRLSSSLLQLTVPGFLRITVPGFLRKHRHVLLLGLAVCAGTVLRLWHLGSSPDWQVDEVTYTSIARNVLDHGSLSLPTAYGAPWKPFLFHPPFYFLLLARWFAIAGAGVYQARLLGVIAATVAVCLLLRLVWKSYGPLTAVFTAFFVATDGWLLYVQRVSYMENILLVIVVATLLAYHKALESGLMRWYLATGVLAGMAVIFKHTGAYALAAIVLAWLFTRRNHRGHAATLGLACVIVAVYVLTMMRLFDFGGHDWYLAQTLVQIKRVLGQQVSGGTLSSPAQFFHLLSHQYAVFVPSLLIALAGIVVLGIDLIRCARARNLAVFGGQVIFPAWALAGLTVFGLISLKYPQYFSMVLLPVYCYLCARAVSTFGSRRRLAAGGLALVACLGMASFAGRVATSPGNVFQEAGRYVATRIPASAVVVAETPVDYEIPQRYCSPSGGPMNEVCLEGASYIVTWQTYLQPINPYHYANFTALLRRGVPIKTIRGFSGTVTIWRLR